MDLGFCEISYRHSIVGEVPNFKPVITGGRTHSAVPLQRIYTHTINEFINADNISNLYRSYIIALFSNFMLKLNWKCEVQYD